MTRLVQRLAHRSHPIHCIERAARLAPLLLLAACAAVGPDYVRPATEVPADFKEQAGWKVAQPADQSIALQWWEAYQDPLLNSLMEQVNISNQTLLQAEAQYRQARATLQGARAAYYPSVTASVSHTRSASGGGAGAGQSGGAGTAPLNSNVLQVDASWEPDLWGRVRRAVESDTASAQASAALLQATRLSTQAQLAQNYFQLRDLDADRALYDKTVGYYRKSLELTQNQYKAGIVPMETVVLAQTQLATTEAQAIDFDVLRAQLEHAIALLTGQAASTFSIPRGTLNTLVPAVPLGLPSALLERRPDIANAERQMAAANAQIGVARSAYFPDLTLAASGGFASSSWANWFSVPNRIWSLGPSLAGTLFDGGLRRAQTEGAIAAYEASLANYRNTVLTGFQEVEDYVAALRILEQEARKQDEAVAYSRRSVELTLNQYKAGIITYLDVITVQTTALSNERTAVDLLYRRLNANVLLIKALGGGWHASALPEPGALSKSN